MKPRGMAVLLLFVFPLLAAGCGSEKGIPFDHAVTSVPPASEIIDANGDAWTISNSGTVLIDGAPAGFSGNVIAVVYYGGVIYQENNADLWWSWNAANNPPWTQVAGDPRL